MLQGAKSMLSSADQQRPGCAGTYGPQLEYSLVDQVPLSNQSETYQTRQQDEARQQQKGERAPEMAPERKRQAQGCSSHQPASIAPPITCPIGIHRDQAQQHCRHQLDEGTPARGNDLVDQVAGGGPKPAHVANAPDHPP